MNLVNSISTKLFDLMMVVLEPLGLEIAIVIVSGVAGVLGLVLFKYISSQKRIADTKDKIKGHMIEIRIYQDDLTVVGAAVGKILLRNFQYLGLNFLPILPLLPPFVLLISQFAVRYGFEPLPEGEDFTLVVELEEGGTRRAEDLVVEGPDWLTAENHTVVRTPGEGRAFITVHDAPAGVWEFRFGFTGGEIDVVKPVAIGDPEDAPRRMQPDRVGDFWNAWLWPAEPTIAAETSLEKISIAGGYPMRSYWWMPDGPLGLMVGVAVYSIIIGAAALKPLGVTI